MSFNRYLAKFSFHIKEQTPSDPLRHQGKLIMSRPLSRILGPLLTCKQFYTEAMPMFYRLNSFHFDDMTQLHKSLSGVALSRLVYFSDISVEYRTQESAVGPKAVKLLAQIHHLRKLSVRTDEIKWLQRPLLPGETFSGTDEDKRKALCKIPGMSGLRSLRGLEDVTFTGGCPMIEEIVKEHIFEPRTNFLAPEKNAAVTKKRQKAEGAANLEWLEVPPPKRYGEARRNRYKRLSELSYARSGRQPR